MVPVSETAADFVDLFELRGERVLIDDEERIVKRIGLDLTPVAIIVENGRVARAQTVPTVRQFRAALPKVDRYKLRPKAAALPS